MAALFGILSLGERATEVDLARGLDAMPQRGGAERASHDAGWCALAVGVADGRAGWEGLFRSGDRTVAVAFAGSLVNVRELAHELGVAERPSSVLPALYERHGEDFVARLRGSFALAVLDGRRELLIAARDPIGGQPLFCVRTPRAILVASELNALLTHDVERKLDARALDYYLTFAYAPSPHTLLEGVVQCAPGTRYVWKRGGAERTARYFPAVAPPVEERELAVSARETKEILLRAIRARVPDPERVGFLLSGGTDTAAVVGCAASIFPGPLRTFTLSFTDCPEVDERATSQESADYFGTRQTTVEVDASCLDTIDAITRHSGLPAGNPATLISHALFRQVRPHVDTVVCGDGGNEIFGGVYKYNQMMSVLAAGGSGPVRSLIQSAGQKLWHAFRDTRMDGLLQKGARLYFGYVGKGHGAERTDLDEQERREARRFYASLESIWGVSNRRALYRPELARRLDDFDSLSLIENAFDPQNPSLLQQLVFVRSHSFLPYNVVPYLEYNATACGVTPLFPLMDQELMEWIYRTPYQQVYGQAPRYLMRQALAGIVPDMIFDRPMKGFNTPVDVWLKTPRWREVVEDCLSPRSIDARGLFDAGYVESLLQSFRSGKRSVPTEQEGKMQPLGLSIWSLVAFELWCRAYL